MLALAKAVFLIVGLVLGSRVGLRGLFMFWTVIGLLYAAIRLPLALYAHGVETFTGSIGSPQMYGALILLMSILLLLWAVIHLGAMLYEVLGLDVLPPGVDHALGAALGGALGWVLIELMFG